MTIYLDNDFVCHLEDDGSRLAVETDFFDGKPSVLIQNYRYVPEGREWTRADGKVFRGVMVAPIKPYKSIMVDVAVSFLDDEQADSVAILFDNWAVGVAYAVGDRRTYEGKLYRCVQAHTSQADWAPPVVPALWTECAKPGEIPVWRQPTGAQDAYQMGDKVHYPDAAGPVYVSTVDNNVWEPGVYGWEEVE